MRSFFLISSIKRCTILAIDYFSLWKIITGNYLTHIPKNWHHDFVRRRNFFFVFFGTDSLRFNPLLWLFFYLRFEVMDTCFNYGHESTKIWFYLRWNIIKYAIETSSRRRFCSIRSKRSNHLRHGFLLSKFSVNMHYTALFEMPTMIARSCIFSHRSFNIILWIFFTISGVIISFGLPLLCSFLQIIRPRLNYAFNILLL